MKKRIKYIIIALIIIVIIVIAFIVFTSCKKKEPKQEETSTQTNVEEDDSSIIKLIENDKGYTTTFKNKDQKFKYNYEDADTAYEIKNEGLGISIKLVYNDYPIGEYKEDIIKEYCWNGHKGFIYEENSSQVSFRIALYEDTSKVVVINANITGLNDSGLDMREVFENMELQEFLCTVEFEN